MHIKRHALYFFSISILGAALYFLIPLPRPLFAPDYSTLVVARDGQLLRAFLNDDQQWCFPPRFQPRRAAQVADGRSSL